MKLKQILLLMFFPEYYKLLVRLWKINNRLNRAIRNYNERFEILENVIKSEVWEQIKQKYSGVKQ